MGGWVVLDQGPVEVGGFLGGCEGLAPLAVLGLTLGEVVEGAGEVGGVDRWVVLRQGSVEIGSFLGGLESLYVSPRLGQAYAERKLT